MNLTLLLQVTAIKMGSCAICDADKVMQGLERSASASTLLAQPAAVRTHTHKGRGRAAEGNRGVGCTYGREAHACIGYYTKSQRVLTLSYIPVYWRVPHSQAFPTVGDHEEDSGTDPSTPLIEDTSLGSNLVGSRLRK